MKTSIHPHWYPDAKITCACGHTFSTGSTKPEIKVEVCSACHPFYTGQQKYVDTLGRVERFQARQQAAAGKTVVSKKAKKLQKKLSDNKATARPTTLKEMFDLAKTQSAS